MTTNPMKNLLDAVIANITPFELDYEQLVQDGHFKPLRSDLPADELAEAAFMKEYVSASGELHQAWLRFLRSKSTRMIKQHNFDNLYRHYYAIPSVLNSDLDNDVALKSLQDMKRILGHYVAKEYNKTDLSHVAGFYRTIKHHIAVIGKDVSKVSRIYVYDNKSNTCRPITNILLTDKEGYDDEQEIWIEV